MTTQTTPAPRFRGYWRPNRQARWTELAGADTYDAAPSALLAALERVRGGDTLVLRGDADPNRRLPAYRAGGKRRL